MLPVTHYYLYNLLIKLKKSTNKKKHLVLFKILVNNKSNQFVTIFNINLL